MTLKQKQAQVSTSYSAAAQKAQACLSHTQFFRVQIFLFPKGFCKSQRRTAVLAPVGSTHLLSFWVMVPFSSFPAMEPSTLLASLAKSRSRTSAGETGTMAKASLSSFRGEVPIWKSRELSYGNLDWESKALIKRFVYRILGNPKNLKFSWH